MYLGSGSHPELKQQGNQGGRIAGFVCTPVMGGMLCHSFPEAPWDDTETQPPRLTTGDAFSSAVQSVLWGGENIPFLSFFSFFYFYFFKSTLLTGFE